MHAHRLTKSVLLQMFNHAISNSKIEVSLYAMKVEMNIKGLCQQLFKSTQSTHNLYYKVIINLPYFTPARILSYTNPDGQWKSG